MIAVKREVLLFHRRMAQCMWLCFWPIYRLEVGRKRARKAIMCHGCPAIMAATRELWFTNTWGRATF